MLSAIGWGGLATTSLVTGCFLAMRALSKRTTGIIMGIGAPISAIAYELVPESMLGGADVGAALALIVFSDQAGLEETCCTNL